MAGNSTPPASNSEEKVDNPDTVPDEDKRFYQFLEDRRLPEETLAEMRAEKLGVLTVADLPDTDLQRFVPKLGDRIAVRQYCSREQAAYAGIGAIPKAAQSLMEKIKGRKRKVSDDTSATKRGAKLFGNSNAKKDKRRFELGWKNFDGTDFTQVRQKRGGGTRHLSLEKNVLMEVVKETAIKLFFPNGKSKLGDVGDFEISLRDSTDEIMDPSKTLIAHIEKRKLKMLRLYIFTKEKPPQEEQPTSQSEVQASTSTSPRRIEEHSQDESYDASNIAGPSTVHQESSFSTVDVPVYLSSDDEVLFGTDWMGVTDDMLHDTVPLSSSSLLESIDSGPSSAVKIKLHRGQVFEELNEAMKSGTVSVNAELIEIEMILPNGTVEKGEDTGGVLRDALTEYWETFYRKCTNGYRVKVPITRTDMKDTWELCGKVLVIGYKAAGYFPVRIAAPFMKYCLGEVCGEEELLRTFLQVVPEHEKQLIEQAQHDFSSVCDDDDFFDFLESHDVKSMVRDDNWQKTLYEVAHREMFQLPTYIAECWKVILKQHLPSLRSNTLEKLYEKLQPSPKRVLSLLQFDQDNSRKHQNVFQYLKKYIRQLSEERLLQFLRFCTGADILIAAEIKVAFVQPLSDFLRCPVAHTCGCLLELPNSYGSYLELAEELNNVLDSKIWVMDIV